MLKRHKISVEGEPGNEATHSSSEVEIFIWFMVQVLEKDGLKCVLMECGELTQNAWELTCLDSAYTREVAPACLVCPYWYSAHARVTFAHA